MTATCLFRRTAIARAHSDIGSLGLERMRVQAPWTSAERKSLAQERPAHARCGCRYRRTWRATSHEPALEKFRGHVGLRRCRRCQMKLWRSGQVRPIRFHHLRHTAASLLLMRGADVPAVQRILRHSDPRLTTETYGHLVPDYLRAQIDRLCCACLVSHILLWARLACLRTSAWSGSPQVSPPLASQRDLEQLRTSIRTHTTREQSSMESMRKLPRTRSRPRVGHVSQGRTRYRAQLCSDTSARSRSPGGL